MKLIAGCAALALGLFVALAVHAQQTPAPAAAPAAPAAPPPPYGAAVTLDQARAMLVAADAEARKNAWNVAIAIVDSAGKLVAFQKIDGTQHSSVDIAIGKAVTAVNYRRPTKALEDAIAGGGAGLRLLSLPNLTPIEGGLPIVIDGKVAGAIGVSGVTSQQDAQVARAGLVVIGAR